MAKPDAEEGVAIEGILKKKSPKGLVKVWQSRYFRLYNDGLHYYKRKEDHEPTGVIPFFSIREIEADKSKAAGSTNRFNITVGADKKGGSKGATRVFSFEALNETDCLNWINTMNKLLRKYQNNQTNKGQGQADAMADAKFWKKGKGAKSIGGGLAADTKRQTVAGGVPEEDENASVTLRIEIVRQETDGPIGCVYRCKDKLKSSNIHYLMHAIKKDEDAYKVGKTLFKAMATLDHPYILKQIHHGRNADAIWTLYSPPFQQRDSLLACLTRHKRFAENVVRFWAAEVASALGYLHKGGYSFRNLSPENIYLDTGGHAVITDFLLCLPASHVMPPECQVPEYTPPEVAADPKKADVLSDWWRLGVLMYELAVGIPPIQIKGNDVAGSVAGFDAAQLQFPPFVTDEFIAVVRELMQPVGKRLGAQGGDYKEIKAHAFFKGGDLNWKDFVAPPWVKDNVVNNMSSSHLKHFTTPKRYVNTLKMELFGARHLCTGDDNLPATNVYCEVKCEGVSENTETLRGQLFPEWNCKFNFDIITAQEFLHESQVIIEVMQEQKTEKRTDDEGNVTVYEYDPFVGSVDLCLTDILAQHPDTLEGWHTVVSAQGMPVGEVKVAFQWKRGKAKGQRIVYKKSSETGTLFEAFGTPPPMEEVVDLLPKIEAKEAPVVVAATVQAKQAAAGVPQQETRRRTSLFGSKGQTKTPAVKLPGIGSEKKAEEKKAAEEKANSSESESDDAKPPAGPPTVPDGVVVSDDDGEASAGDEVASDSSDSDAASKPPPNKPGKSKADADSPSVGPTASPPSKKQSPPKKGADSSDDSDVDVKPPSKAKPAPAKSKSKKKDSDSDEGGKVGPPPKGKKPPKADDSDDETPPPPKKTPTIDPKKSPPPSAGAAKAGPDAKCGTCGCEKFKKNPFKKNQCSTCFHDH